MRIQPGALKVLGLETTRIVYSVRRHVKRWAFRVDQPFDFLSYSSSLSSLAIFRPSSPLFLWMIFISSPEHLLISASYKFWVYAVFVARVFGRLTVGRKFFDRPIVVIQGEKHYLTIRRFTFWFFSGVGNASEYYPSIKYSIRASFVPPHYEKPANHVDLRISIFYLIRENSYIQKKKHLSEMLSYF